MIDEDAAGRRRIDRGGDHLAHVVVIADAQDEQLGALGRLGGRGREDAAVRLGPGLSLGGRTVEAAHLMARADKVARHGPAHHTQTCEPDLHSAPLAWL